MSLPTNFSRPCPTNGYYDVFLSFRGEDTRYGFTANLYRSLLEKKVYTFMDVKLTGEDIDYLFEMITKSRMAVVIYSKKFASSDWCLRELETIMQRRKEKKMLMIPIFYKVDIHELKHLTGKTAEYLDKHVQDYGEATVKKWKDAIIKFGKVSGLCYKETHGRYEYDFITDVITAIKEKLEECEKTNYILKPDSKDVPNQDNIMIEEGSASHQNIEISPIPQLEQEHVTTSLVLQDEEKLLEDGVYESYVEKIPATARKWYMNMLEVDKLQPPEKSYDGKLYTSTPVELFRALTDIFHLVQENSTAVMLHKTALEIIQVMIEFQAAERKILEERAYDTGLEFLCALVNNNMRCYGLAMELSNNTKEALPQNYADQVNFAEACIGFLEVGQETVHHTARIIFEDPGVSNLLDKLYHADWCEGQVTEFFVATCVDYFKDVKMYLEESSFKSFVEACLEETIVVYVDHLLTQKNYITEETIEQMKIDEEVLLDFFNEYINVLKVESKIRTLRELRELASGKSIDGLVLIYSKILEHQPDCPVEVVKKIIALRQDISMKLAKEVIQECMEIYANSLVEGSPPKAGFVFRRVKCLNASSRS